MESTDTRDESSVPNVLATTPTIPEVLAEVSEEPTESLETSSADSSYHVLKTWDFDGFIIESIYWPKQEENEEPQSEKRPTMPLKNDEGDDTSTIILDEDEIQDQLQTIREIDQQAASSSNTEDTLNLVPIAEEQTPAPNDSEDQFGGAAGLWTQDYRLPCLTRQDAPVPTFQRLEVQRSTFDVTPKSDWVLDDQPLNVGKPCSPFEDLVKMSTDDLISTKEDSDCAVCKRPLEAGRGFVLKGCLHTFCRRCLVHAINDSATAVINCPSKEVVCRGEVQQSEIKSLLNPEAYEKYNLEMLLKMDALDIAEVHEQYEFVENIKEFGCDICQQPISRGDGIVIKNCLHEYCKPCLGKYIETSDTAVVPCPFRDEDGAVCIGFLLDSEVRSLVSVPVYLEVVQRSLAEAEATNPNSYHCKTPDCPAWVEIDAEVENFQCQACNRENCVRCKAIHQGVSCNDYYDSLHGDDRRSRENVATEQQVRGMIAAKNAQPCPTCGILVQRNEGCREMVCTKCNTKFIWYGN
jgi:hypothetical protein